MVKLKAALSGCHPFRNKNHSVTTEE